MYLVFGEVVKWNLGGEVGAGTVSEGSGESLLEANRRNNLEIKLWFLAEQAKMASEN